VAFTKRFKILFLWLLVLCAAFLSSIFVKHVCAMQAAWGDQKKLFWFILDKITNDIE